MLRFRKALAITAAGVQLNLSGFMAKRVVIMANTNPVTIAGGFAGLADGSMVCPPLSVVEYYDCYVSPQQVWTCAAGQATVVFYE